MSTTKVVYKTWRQASVKLPDGQIHHRLAVFVTSDGLEIFDKPTDDPLWSSPVDFAATAEPRNPRLHIGIDITTAEGVAVVTPTGGCMSCGSSMRSWAPAWASTVAAWPKDES